MTEHGPPPALLSARQPVRRQPVLPPALLSERQPVRRQAQFVHLHPIPGEPPPHIFIVPLASPHYASNTTATATVMRIMNCPLLLLLLLQH